MKTSKVLIRSQTSAKAEQIETCLFEDIFVIDLTLLWWNSRSALEPNATCFGNFTQRGVSVVQFELWNWFRSFWVVLQTDKQTNIHRLNINLLGESNNEHGNQWGMNTEITSGLIYGRVVLVWAGHQVRVKLVLDEGERIPTSLLFSPEIKFDIHDWIIKLCEADNKAGPCELCVSTMNGAVNAESSKLTLPIGKVMALSCGHDHKHLFWKLNEGRNCISRSIIANVQVVNLPQPWHQISPQSTSS